MGDVLDNLNKLLNENDKVVVAVSGGPDSMCLLNLLINSNLDNKNIVVAHINHKVRIESDSEELLVKRICEDNNIVFESMRLKNPNHKNFEAYARTQRYRFFEALIDKYSAQYLMTAHHGDDLIETVLMKIVRGSNIRGYGGFSSIEDRVNYKIVRPLIEKTKEDILKYNQDNEIDYAFDRSNDNLIYTRNRYRHKMLPVLKGEDKDVHLKFKQFSDNIISISNFFEKYTKNEEKGFIIDNKIKIDKLLNYDLFIQRKFIYDFLFTFYQDDIILIQKIHIDNVIDMINSARPNISLDLPKSKKIIKAYNTLYISDNIDTIVYQKKKLEDKLSWGDKVIELVETSDLSNNFVIYLNSKDINLPLYVRSKKTGDRIKIKNMSHYKKVNEIFINEKIELRKRYTWPIVVDSNDEIVWIPGLKKSYLDSQKSKKYDIIIKYH